MDMRKIVARLVWSLRQPVSEPDYVLDRRIRNALLSEAAATTPVGAWDRLLKAITERKPVRSHGMWVLDEPFRDPPESPPTMLSGRELKRAQRLYEHSRGHLRYQLRETFFNGLIPSFVSLVNW
jgi:hypothetical protein